ncbi:MAG TPA: 4Fe-4S binding protein [Anaerolineales bacterium]|nr:4Fe-4S binding protein [Anaerolineales bacterium]
MGHSKRAYHLLLNLWPVYKLGIWVGRKPGIGSVLSPAFSSKIHQVTMLPVNEPITQGQQTVLPYTLLEELVLRASARFIMNECVCRQQENCQAHPIDLGCIYLGEGAARIHPTLGRSCDVDEARQHIQRGMQAGLYPLIAHTVLDAFNLGIPYRRMLTVCFCCECCCLVQRGLRKGPASLHKAILPLPGLRVLVDQDCSACGNCVDVCPVSAISLNSHRAEINGQCKGCGICLNACPSGAIKMEMDGKTDLWSAFNDRITGYADITS